MCVCVCMSVCVCVCVCKTANERCTEAFPNSLTVRKEGTAVSLRSGGGVVVEVEHTFLCKGMSPIQWIREYIHDCPRACAWVRASMCMSVF